MYLCTHTGQKAHLQLVLVGHQPTIWVCERRRHSSFSTQPAHHSVSRITTVQVRTVLAGWQDCTYQGKYYL